MTQHLFRLTSPIAVVTLAMTTLACALIEAWSSPVPGAIATRTPWPTFTSMAISSPPPVAIADESTVLAPTPAPPTATPPVSPAVSTLASAPSPTFTSAPADTSNPGQSPVPTDTLAASTLPTVAEAATPSPTPTPTAIPTATATETPIPTSAPTEIPTATPIPGTPGWSFMGVRIYADQYEGDLRLVGEMTNNTGASQELVGVTGTFYDGQGQVISDGYDILDNWPVEVVPPGGRIPFEMLIDGAQSIANFEIHVEAEATSDMPRQDFEFLDLSQSIGEEGYCFTGQLRNAGGELEWYLNIVAVLYDGDNGVINYGDYYEPFPYGIKGDETLDFEICIDTFGLPVASHDIQAWGE